MRWCFDTQTAANKPERDAHTFANLLLNERCATQIKCAQGGTHLCHRTECAMSGCLSVMGNGALHKIQCKSNMH